ncbi:MAG: portal protein [Methylobacter sp.]
MQEEPLEQDSDDDKEDQADILKEALELFKRASEHESNNREQALDDLKFARLSEQWHPADRKNRELEGRPCLTINRLPAFIRKVVNTARQNDMSIKVHPVDNSGDPKTAEIYDGIIKNIQATSSAAIAYDTGLDSAVTMGFGYWRINLDYAHDDTFDLDIKVERISNPFSVYGDHTATGADTSDWNYCFILQSVTKDDFKARYKGAEQFDWATEGYNDMDHDWSDGENVIVAEYWTRNEVPRTILMLSDSSTVGKDVYDENLETFEALGVTVINTRKTKSYKVMQRIMSGAEILETNEWAGRYIPIVAVYGEEVNVEGKRHFRSLVRDSKDPQRMFNYWRTASTELVALAPKTPFIGPKGAFNTDSKKWATANNKSHAFIEYDGQIPPQRQEFAGPPAGALQEALNAADDIKAIMGIYDAAVGQRSNEVSGLAINARKVEGDISTYHFIDNQARAICHTGRILIDLIPHVYNGKRIVRILGGRTGKEPKNVQLGAPVEDDDGIERIYDLSVGKYDLVVDVGTNSPTQRQEQVAQLTELIRSFPEAAPLVGDIIAENLDLRGADEIVRRLKAMLPPQIQGQDPQVQAIQQQMDQQKQQGMQMISDLQQQLHDAQQLAQSLQLATNIDQQKADIDGFKAETDRLKLTTTAMGPEQIQALVMQTLQQALTSPDVLQQPPIQQPTTGAIQQ